MAADIHVHHEVLRSHLKGCFGYEIATEGDSFKCVFKSAEDAVMYCVLVQLDLLTAPWQIESGGHELLQGTPKWSDISRPQLSSIHEKIIMDQCAKPLESFASKQRQRATLFSAVVAGTTSFSQQWLALEASALRMVSIKSRAASS
jgi:hypothetical protein